MNLEILAYGMTTSAKSRDDFKDRIPEDIL
jgi:hypothetical protein